MQLTVLCDRQVPHKTHLTSSTDKLD